MYFNASHLFKASEKESSIDPGFTSFMKKYFLVYKQALSANLLLNNWHQADSSHRHSRSRLLTDRIGGVTCMINPRWRGNRAKNYKTPLGNPCFSRFKTSRCLESLRINIFWKQLIIAEVLSTICVISVEFLVKISLVKCVVNWSLGQFETFIVQNMYF